MRKIENAKCNTTAVRPMSSLHATHATHSAEHSTMVSTKLHHGASHIYTYVNNRMRRKA